MRATSSATAERPNPMIINSAMTIRFIHAAEHGKLRQHSGDQRLPVTQDHLQTIIGQLVRQRGSSRQSVRHSRAGAAGVDQLAVVAVIAEQQRAEGGARTF